MTSKGNEAKSKMKHYFRYAHAEIWTQVVQGWNLIQNTCLSGDHTFGLQICFGKVEIPYTRYAVCKSECVCDIALAYATLSYSSFMCFGHLSHLLTYFPLFELNKVLLLLGVDCVILPPVSMVVGSQTLLKGPHITWNISEKLSKGPIKKKNIVEAYSTPCSIWLAGHSTPLFRTTNIQ